MFLNHDDDGRGDLFYSDYNEIRDDSSEKDDVEKDQERTDNDTSKESSDLENFSDSKCDISSSDSNESEVTNDDVIKEVNSIEDKDNQDINKPSDSTPTKEFQYEIIKETSLPLPSGGDTHIHLHPDGVTVTTRPKIEEGEVAIHDDFTAEGDYIGTHIKAGGKRIDLTENISDKTSNSVELKVEGHSNDDLNNEHTRLEVSEDNIEEKVTDVQTDSQSHTLSEKVQGEDSIVYEERKDATDIDKHEGEENTLKKEIVDLKNETTEKEDTKAREIKEDKISTPESVDTLVKEIKEMVNREGEVSTEGNIINKNEGLKQGAIDILTQEREKKIKSSFFDSKKEFIPEVSDTSVFSDSKVIKESQDKIIKEISERSLSAEDVDINPERKGFNSSGDTLGETFNSNDSKIEKSSNENLEKEQIFQTQEVSEDNREEIKDVKIEPISEALSDNVQVENSSVWDKLKDAPDKHKLEVEENKIYERLIDKCTEHIEDTEKREKLKEALEPAIKEFAHEEANIKLRSEEIMRTPDDQLKRRLNELFDKPFEVYDEFKRNMEKEIGKDEFKALETLIGEKLPGISDVKKAALIFKLLEKKVFRKGS